ncbi:MAG: hypothetical protein KAT70_01190, partial [Thermoplasmata archaeon]|nr:hypothetical protein [Thermoplasmata archaeon]
LSAGKKQLLQFVLALGHRPKLLFLDEPTGGVDHENKAWMWSVLSEFKREGGEMLISSHEGKEIDVLGDRLLVLEEGRVKIVAGKAEAQTVLGYRTRLLISPPERMGEEEAREKLVSVPGAFKVKHADKGWVLLSALGLPDAVSSVSPLKEGWEVYDSREADLRDVYDMVREGGR